MTLNESSAGVPEQSTVVNGEISIFVKTTGLDKHAIAKLNGLFRNLLMNELNLDPALVKIEESTESTRAGTLRSCRIFYKISRLSD
jgi:hypothetical protein